MNWTRPRTWRCNDQLMPKRGILCFKSALGLIEATKFKQRNIGSTILVDVKRFLSLNQTDEVFGTQVAF